MNDLTLPGGNTPCWKDRLARLGQLSFLFFLVKGLVWVGLFAAAWAASGT